VSVTVLMNAGPWLPVPPEGYGGIENVVATLVPQLRRRGVRVVLATVGDSRIAVEKRISVFPQGQFAHLQEPYNRVSGIAHAHLQRVIAELRRHAEIDLVHDHVEVVGPSSLSAMGTDARPTLHTLHWDLRKHHEFYSRFDGAGKVWVNGVSAAQLAAAPLALREHSVGHVHLATPLADDADRRLLPHKGEHAVVLGRITRNKGQHVAARIAEKLGRPLVLAGPVGPFHDHGALTTALATDPITALNPDVRYWCDEVAPRVDGDLVRWVGTVRGAELERLVSTARAALFPIRWDEPGGTAVVESLALGTPVVGYARGCLPELVDPGRTGLLAEPEDEDELAASLADSDRIDPAECVRAAARRFTPALMAERYLGLYEEVLARLA
jgi:glycosyltransferase involved in cell wall biosynthesis